MNNRRHPLLLFVYMYIMLKNARRFYMDAMSVK